MPKFLVLGLLSWTVSTHCLGQAPKFLMFEKSRNRKAFYYIGDEVSIRIRGDRSKFTDRIVGLEDSVIVFRSYRINVKDITHIYVDDKQKFWYVFRYKAPALLKIAGAGYLALDVINTRELDVGTMLLGGALVGAGFLAQRLISDKTRIRGKRKLTVVIY